jgi:N utilization substance protein B
MALPKQKFRELVFQLLFSGDFGSDEEVISLLMGELAVSKKTVREAIEHKAQIEAKQTEIDRLIANTSKSYDFERISRVERSILRLGIYELLHDTTIPLKVAIAEAIRLARKFGTPESASFVNAVLDAVKPQSVETTPEEQAHEHSLQSTAGPAA